MKKITLLLVAAICGVWCAMAQNMANGHEYVDLGLPSGTLWATTNVGADASERYGDYFAWGETEVKEIWNVNLLVNPSCDNNDFEGWIKSGNIDVASKFWQMSYTEASMQQDVDLLACGFTEEMLDEQPYLVASGLVSSVHDNGRQKGITKMFAYCLDAAGQILATLTLQDIMSGNAFSYDWDTYKGQMQIPAGTRKLRFYFGGRDCLYWNGFYGPRFDDLYLSLSKTKDETQYVLQIADCQNGVVTADKLSCAMTDTVHLSIVPDEDYVLQSISVTRNREVPVPERMLNNNTFLMPSCDATVSATFCRIANIPIMIIGPAEGTLAVSQDVAQRGDEVQITFTPANEKHFLSSYIVTTAEGTTLEVSSTGKFRVPATESVTVSVTCISAFEVMDNNPFFDGFEDGAPNTKVAGEWMQMSRIDDDYMMWNYSGMNAHEGSQSAMIRFSYGTVFTTPLYLHSSAKYAFEMYLASEFDNETTMQVFLSTDRPTVESPYASDKILLYDGNLILNQEWQLIEAAYTVNTAGVYFLSIVLNNAGHVMLDNVQCSLLSIPPVKITVIDGTASAETAILGTEITITAFEPAEGKEFDKWEVVSGSVVLADETNATTTFTMPAEEVSVKATYKLIENGISDTVADDADAEVIGIYTVLGQKLAEEPISGVFIVVFSNGKTVKIVK